MNGVIVVSHSSDITKGILKLINEMVVLGEKVLLYEAGGTDDGRLGTSAIKVKECIERCAQCDNILIFYDIGSSVMSAEMAIELLEDQDLASKVKILDSPIVEGAFAATVTASTTTDIKIILEEVNSI